MTTPAPLTTAREMLEACEGLLGSLDWHAPNRREIALRRLAQLAARLPAEPACSGGCTDSQYEVGCPLHDPEPAAPPLYWSEDIKTWMTADGKALMRLQPTAVAEPAATTHTEDDCEEEMYRRAADSYRAALAECQALLDMRCVDDHRKVGCEDTLLDVPKVLAARLAPAATTDHAELREAALSAAEAIERREFGGTGGFKYAERIRAALRTPAPPPAVTPLERMKAAHKNMVQSAQDVIDAYTAPPPSAPDTRMVYGGTPNAADLASEPPCDHVWSNSIGPSACIACGLLRASAPPENAAGELLRQSERALASVGSIGREWIEAALPYVERAAKEKEPK